MINIIKIDTTNHSHYYQLVPLTKQTVKSTLKFEHRCQVSMKTLTISPQP